MKTAYVVQITAYDLPSNGWLHVFTSRRAADKFLVKEGFIRYLEDENSYSKRIRDGSNRFAEIRPRTLNVPYKKPRKK